MNSRKPASSARMDPRAAAASALVTVIFKQEQSFTGQFSYFEKHLNPKDIGLFKALCFGVARQRFSLEALADQLLEKKLRNKDRDIHALLLIGIYQLDALRMPAYAAVDSCIKAAGHLKKNWAKGLLNATLRRYQQEREGLRANLSEDILADHPAWLLDRIKADWPNQYPDIIATNNAAPPLCLRVNRQHFTRDAYLDLLKAQEINARPAGLSADGIYLEDPGLDLYKLPHFDEGSVSVQDEAAQLTTPMLSLAKGLRVLDACAAPGGKTCHMLEHFPDLKILAIDKDAERLTRVDQNLERLNLQAETLAADILSPDDWWKGELYDRILCDAPCSATGVIRRHPDIKSLRRADDIRSLAALQLRLLETLWQCLKPGGILLYTTCSILREENADVIEAFLQQTADCRLLSDTPAKSLPLNDFTGYPLLPTLNGHDGFYYAKLTKQAETTP